MRNQGVACEAMSPDGVFACQDGASHDGPHRIYNADGSPGFYWESKCRANHPDGSERECDLSAGHPGVHQFGQATMWDNTGNSAPSTVESKQESVTELANRLESAVGDLRQRYVLKLAHDAMRKQYQEGKARIMELQAELAKERQEVQRQANLRKVVEGHKTEQMEKVSQLRKEIAEVRKNFSERVNSLAAYQASTDKYAVYPGVDFPPTGVRLAKTMTYLGLGLAGEAGEVANVIKKVLRAGHSFVDNDEADVKLREEMGDTLWYLARIAVEKGWSLDDIAQENLAKLSGRKERGELKERAARCVSQSYQGRDLRCEQAKGHPGFHTDSAYSWS